VPANALRVANFPPPGAQLPANAAAERVIAGFPTAHAQEKLNWCWAAVLSAVSRVLPRAEGPRTQREVVAKVQGPAGSDADDMEDLLVAVRRMGWDCTPLVRSDLDVLDFDRDIRTPIDDGRPIPICVRWKAGGSHAICAFGYGRLGGSPALILYDPSAIDGEPDNLTMVSIAGMDNYEHRLASGRQPGRWTEAYLLER